MSAEPKRRRARLAAAVAPAVAVAALAAAACGRREAPPAVAPASPASERLTIAAAPVADMKPVAATVATRRTGEARARIGGTLTRLLVHEGDVVRQGQTLAVVSDERLQLEARAYAAQAAAAQAEADRATADLKRIRALFDKGVYARARLDQAEAEAKAARGALEAARAQAAASRELSAQGAILAPAAGRVLHADVPQGAVVAAGQSVVTVTAGEPLLRLETPEAGARGLKPGDTVVIDARDLPGAATGTIVQVYPSVTAGLVTADVAAAGLSDQRIGQRVRVTVKVGERTAITIPRRFVSTRYGIDYVRVLDRSGRAGEVAVQLAPAAGEGRVEVLSGLANGDVIVAPGAGS